MLKDNHCVLFTASICTGLLRRLKLFRELNQEDVTVLNYFDELEIHPESISEFLVRLG